MIPAGTRAAIFGCDGLTLTAVERAFFAETSPFGFILFARNVDTPEQILRLTEALRDCVGWQCPIMIDQEGGRVQRLRAPQWREWPPPLDEVAQSSDPARSLYLRYRIIADELLALGIDVNCVPCADLMTETTHPFLKNRTLGSAVGDVARLARAVSQGCLDSGVLPVLKHLPGHGRATADSHVDLPRVSTDLSILRAEDFAAFSALSDLPLGMTAHVVYDALDPGVPATVSNAAIKAVRDEIGFGGLLMTDDLCMGALPGSMTDRTRASLAAGCDMILHCNGDMGEMSNVANETPILSGIVRSRAEAVMAMRRTPDPLDIKAATAEFEALVTQG